jgi:hypothetical protein
MTDLLRRSSGAARRRTAAALALATAALATPGASHAFCRTTTTPIPASYSPTRGCYTQGLPLYWAGACVGYTLNRAASASVPLATATKVLDEAFAAWNGVTCAATGAAVGIAASDLGPVDCADVRYNQDGPNQNVIVFRDNGWPYSDPNNTLGLTTVTFNADTGEIFDADMEINSSGKNLSTSSTVPVNGYDLLSVVTHEAGHFLGLAHATDATATMYASYKPGTSALRTLSADDIAGICAIYPSATTRNVASTIAPPSGVLTASACDPSPRHGFSTTCAANPAPSSSSSSAGCALATTPRDGVGSTRSSRASWFGLVAVAALALARRRQRRLSR